MRTPTHALRLRSLLVLLLALPLAPASAAPLLVPAFAAYGDPGTKLKINKEEKSVQKWGAAAGQSLIWYGKLASTGALTAAVQARLENGHANDLNLVLWPIAAPDKQQKGSAIVTSARVEFPEFQITSPGYYGLRLENQTTDLLGDVLHLALEGPAAENAHFSLVERRNAASVHLNHAASVPKDTEQQWFYNEVTARSEPVNTFYMACGFSRGYFGMQVNSPTERRIIFSVWDSGGEAVDRKKVGEENRVKLLEKGDGVHAEDFGNEGTGGHSHLKILWKMNEPQKFLLHCQPKGLQTVYTAFYWMPEKQDWSLIASFQAPKDGKWLRGHHCFVENFGGSTGHLQRVADFGPAWVADSKGAWTELLTAGFTHDSHGKSDRLDYFACPTRDQVAFTLSNGGWLADPPTKYGQQLTRQPSGRKSPGLLPALPKRE